MTTRFGPLSLVTLCLLLGSPLVAGSPLPAALVTLQKDNTTPEQRLRNAQAALESNRYDDAKKELKAALATNKDMPAANLLLAFIYWRQHKSKDALKYVKAAIKTQPEYADAHYLLALLLFEKNDLQKSREEIDVAIRQGTKLPGAFSLRGDLYLTSNSSKPALESYEEALRLARPDDKDVPALRERVGALRNYVDFAQHRNDPSYVRPVLLNFPVPRYTEEARSGRVQGSVRLAVLVDERGQVSSTLIFTRLGYGLDEEAVRAAKALRFTPASKDGKPVPFWSPVEVEFHLR